MMWDSLSPCLPSSRLHPTVCLSTNMGTGKSGEQRYIFGAIIFWKNNYDAISMMPVFGAFFFLVIKRKTETQAGPVWLTLSAQLQGEIQDFTGKKCKIKHFCVESVESDVAGVISG